MKVRTSAILAAASLMVLTVPAQAATIIFDFEETNLGVTSSLTETNDGTTLTVTRENGTAFQVRDIGASAPEFGSRTLGPFNNNVGDAFMLNFSALLSSISLQAGDFAPSDADIFTLRIFSGANGTGTLLGTATTSQDENTGFPNFSTLSLNSTTPFGSAIFVGGSPAFANSVFLDNVVVNTISGAVPEPATWAMMLLGFFGIGAAMRRPKVRIARQSVAFA